LPSPFLKTTIINKSRALVFSEVEEKVKSKLFLLKESGVGGGGGGEEDWRRRRC